jgi:hypothetical protein
MCHTDNGKLTKLPGAGKSQENGCKAGNRTGSGKKTEIGATGKVNSFILSGCLKKQEPESNYSRE